MKIYFKNEQIIAKLDEVFSYILNMSWLYHFNYNWKVWFMWFYKKHLDNFFNQTSINVLKNKKNCNFIFIWKITRIILEALASKSILYIYQTLDESIMRKKGVLQFSFRIVMTICNSLYFYTHECYWTTCISCIMFNSPYIWSYINAIQCNLIGIMSQQLFFNYFATPLWL
jgi:hypothetical protein